MTAVAPPPAALPIRSPSNPIPRPSSTASNRKVPPRIELPPSLDTADVVERDDKGAAESRGEFRSVSLPSFHTHISSRYKSYKSFTSFHSEAGAGLERIDNVDCPPSLTFEREAILLVMVSLLQHLTNFHRMILASLHVATSLTLSVPPPLFPSPFPLPIIVYDGFLSPAPPYPLNPFDINLAPCSRTPSPLLPLELPHHFANHLTVQSPSSSKGVILARPDEEDRGPQRPPIRPNPAVRSKFDLEPNPFEQSFSRSSHNSTDSIHERITPPRGGDATSIQHNALPPLSSLTSPAAADPSQFPWLANHSLRTGPLSPAMLAGPQHANGQHHAHAASHLRNGTSAEHMGQEGGFDSSTFRTGFTPGTGSGFTPGYSSLMNGTGFGTLPLPSPNTAAFLNMVTNSTPIEGGDGGNHHQTLHAPDGQPPVHPPSAIPPHMQHHGLSHISNHPEIPQDTITPGTLSALTGVYNDMNRANGHGPNPHGPGYYSGGMNGQPPVQQMSGHVDYAQQSANAASQAANGLFLLSQAHQELSKRDGEGKGSEPSGSVGPPPVSAKSTNGVGQKRKSDTGPAKPAAKKGKKISIPLDLTPEKNDIKAESASPTFSLADMADLGDDDMDPLGNKNETEEDKRKNFLERNRQAALKCRQRKKAWLNELQSKVEQLTVENERLQQTIGGLHEEVGRLSSIMMQHRDCGLGVPAVPPYGRPIR